MVARIPIGVKPCGIVATPQTVWVSVYGASTVRAIDVATNRPGPDIPVGQHPCGVALGGDSLWVENYGSNDVTRVDVATGKVLATVKVGALPYDVCYAFGAAWVTDYGSGTVSRIDPTTNTRTAITTGGQPTGIVGVGGAVWVALGADGTVARIDPATLAVTDRVKVGASADWTAAAGTTLWVTDAPDLAVARVDTAARTLVGTGRTATVPVDGDQAAGAVWIPTRSGGLYRIDPATGAMSGPFASGAGFPFVVAGSGDALWAADYLGTDVLRLDATRIR